MSYVFGKGDAIKPGDLVRWMHHGPGEGKICKVKNVYYNTYNQPAKFTLEDDPYVDYQYDISDIRRATYNEINQCVPQIEFFNEKHNPNKSILDKLKELINEC
jgi:hypothetical protein